ncbi:MAG: Nif3-like dinuclear metal center hexameric protein [Planctomycetaceae bacterium]|nr:Nif3-like dinuclear metal center hexameric protein [Planctomycetaceae bacterium]
MPTVQDVCGFLMELAPLRLSEEWDNVGLLVGRSSREVTDLMTCLTLTPDVVRDAVEKHVGMIVSHHPVMFRKTQRITEDSVEGRMLLDLIEAGIAIYSPHTAFDSASAGINQQLSERMGLTGIQPFRPSEDTPSVGGGRFGRIPTPVSLAAFLETVRIVTSADYIEYVGEPDGVVSQVGVGCGSAGEFLRDAIRERCDTFVTGETRFHTALEARNAGVNLILLGHYSSERPAVEWLADEIGRQFPLIRAVASTIESDPLKLHGRSQ